MALTITPLTAHTGIEATGLDFAQPIDPADQTVLRDAIACKPAVLAETDDYVAMASEFRSLANLPGIEQATIWEPKPAVVYSWSLQ